VPKEGRWSHLQANAKQPSIGKLIDEADPTGYKFVRLGSHALNGLQPWMQVQLSTKQHIALKT